MRRLMLFGMLVTVAAPAVAQQRFPIAGQIGGRTELNYSMYAKNADIPIPPINVTSILFGLTMPLK